MTRLLPLAIVSCALMLGLPRAIVAQVNPPDLDGDGIAEAIGLPDSHSRTVVPAVFLNSGATGSPIQVLRMGDPDDGFGWAATWVGDADLDGMPDVAVAAPVARTSNGYGRVYVFSSANGRLIHILSPTQSGSFGSLVEPMSDLDGDGIPDIGVWSRFDRPSGQHIDMRWAFSARTGMLLSPIGGEAEVLAQVAADVDASNVVDSDDAIVVIENVDEPITEENQAADVSGDATIDGEDVALVMNNLGAAVVTPSGPVGYVGWTSFDPVAGTLSIVNQRWLPCLGLPGCADPGGGSTGPINFVPANPGADDPLSGGPGDLDDHPDDPFNNGPGCSPDLDAASRYLCLRPEQDCTEFSFSGGGGAGTGAINWTITGGVFVVPGEPGVATSLHGVTTATIRVCQPGEVVVSIARENPSCPFGRARIFHAVRVDVDLDSDNTSMLADAARTTEEELVEALGKVEESPGKVIVVTSGDSDGDGLPDRVDGFDIVPEDGRGTSSPHRSPKVVVDIAGPLPEGPAIIFGYPASDPLMIGNEQDPFAPLDGGLRLWTTDTDQPRSGLSIRDGGNFIPAEAIPYSVLADALGPPPWEFYVEAVTPGVHTISVQVDPDGVSPRIRPDDADGGPQGVMCPDAAQVNATELVVQVKACEGCDEFEVPGLLGVRELDPNELEDSVPFYDRYSLFRFEIRDFRTFSADGLSVGGVPLSLTQFSGAASRTGWVYFADEVRADAPLGATRLPLPGGDVPTQYNPDGIVPTLLKLLHLPHVKELDVELGPAMQRAEVLFNADPTNPANPDSGIYGKLLHREASLGMRGKPRWKTNVWMDQTTKKVLSVNDPDFHGSGNVMEIDLAYMKRGKSIQVGQTFRPDDVVDVFELKTSHGGKIDALQLEKYQDAMGGRNPIKVHVPKRQQRGAAGWQIVENPRAIRKIRLLQNAAIGLAAGFGVFNTAMALASPSTTEDDAYEDLIISIEQFRRVRGSNDAEAKLALVDIIARMRTWLTAATGDAGVANVATEIFALRVIDQEWQ